MIAVNPPRWRRRVAGVLCVVAAVALAGCSSSQEGVADEQPSLLKVAATANITTWDPVKSFSTEAMYLANVYEPLLWKNPPDAAEEYTPALATSWETSGDGLTWTFKLREGVKFHDGEVFDSAAVKASYEAAKDRGGAAFIWDPLESIETPDPTTVVLNLSYPAPMDLIAASTYGAWIVSPKALEAAKADETYFESGIDAGTGPYKIEKYTPDKEVVLVSTDDYWDEDARPIYDRVVIAITAEAGTQQQMLAADEVDLAMSIPLENVSQFENDADYEIRSFPAPFSYLGFFNTTKPPLDNPKVRQALSYALPYDDIITVGAAGHGTRARGPVPEGIFPFDEATPRYETDLDRAKSLLADAGYPDGGFTLDLTYAAENQNEARFVPLIKDAFAKIGVTVEPKAMLWNQQWELAKGDPTQAQDMFVVLYWPTYSDAGADNLYSLFHSSEQPFFNLSYWASAEYDALIDEAMTLTGTDRDAAAAKYSEAMRLLYEAAPGFFLYDAQAVYVVPKKLDGFNYNLNYPFSIRFADLRPAA